MTENRYRRLLLLSIKKGGINVGILGILNDWNGQFQHDPCSFGGDNKCVQTNLFLAKVDRNRVNNYKKLAETFAI